jgi:hypothetical protein
MLNVTKGPAGRGEGKRILERLAADGKTLSILGDENSANFNYVKHFVLDIDAWRLNFAQYSNKKIGEEFGLEWAEHFHYIDYRKPDLLEEYIRNNAVKI